MMSKRLFQPLWSRVHTCRRLTILHPRVQFQVQILSFQIHTSGCNCTSKTQQNIHNSVHTNSNTTPKIQVKLDNGVPKNPSDAAKLQSLEDGIQSDVSEQNGDLDSQPAVSESEAAIASAGLEDLYAISSNVVKVIDAALVIQRLSQLHQEKEFNVEAVLTDARMKPVVTLLHGKINQLPIVRVIACFKALLGLTAKDFFLLESLERQVLWSVRKWQIHNIIKLIEVLHKHQETPFRRQMLAETKSTIERRWVEISNPYDLVSLMYIFDKPKDKVVFSKIQERALDLIDMMAPTSLYKVLYLSSKQKVRNAPLIRASVYHLNKKGINLEFFQLANLLYACSSLNIYDDGLLTTTLDNMKDKLGSLDSPKTALMMLKSISILRWHQNDVIDAILGYIGNHLSQLTIEEKVGIVLSIARLNHSSSATKTLVAKLSTDGLKDLKETSPMMYLDYVWSLCVLMYADESLVASVLSPDFLSKVTGNSFEEYFRQVSAIKLMNVQTSARHDLTTYQGPSLPEDWLSHVSQNLIRPGRGLSESVVTAVTSTAPVDRFTKIDVLTPFGYFLDVEMFVNQAGQPLPYQQTSENKPANTFRVGLKILDFPDMTQKSVHPVGLHVMAHRHLEKEGYTVVELPYHELSDKSTVVQKVQYVQNKIKQAVSPPSGT